MSQPVVAAGGGSSYDADASALFARMSPTPDATRKGVINTLILALKTGATSASNIWAKIDVMYVLAADSAANARLDWKNLGGAAAYDALVVGSPTFTTDRGYTNNSNTGYLNAVYNPTSHAVQYTQNSAHLACWNRTSTASSSTTPSMTFFSTFGKITTRSSADNFYVGINDGTNSVVGGAGASTDGSGMFIGTRPDSATKRGFRNGTQFGSDVAVASTGIPNAAMKIGGVAAIGNFEWSFQSIGANLTTAEVLDFYNAVQAYMTAVGA